MMTQSLPIAGKLPIKTLVAKQLPTNINTYTYKFNDSCIVISGQPVVKQNMVFINSAYSEHVPLNRL